MEWLQEALGNAAKAAGVDVAEIVLPADQQVVLGGMRFHYLDWGGSGKPLMFLHGGGLTAHTYDLVCLALRDRYRCLAIDLRGHGDSEWSPTGDYSHETNARDVELFAEHLQLDKFVLIGMSLGGLTSIAFAGQHHQRLAGLVIVDVGPEIQEAGRKRIREFVTGPSELDSIEEFADRAIAFNPRRDRQRLMTSLRHNLRKTPEGKWTWKHDPRRHGRMQPMSPEYAKQLWQWVEAIGCPTLVVRGGESDVFLDEHAAALVKRLKHGRHVTVPRAGHTVQGDNAKGFIAELRRFFELIDY